MHVRHRNSVAFTVVVTVLVLLGALPVAVVIALSSAPSTMVLATVLAALPVGPLVGCFMWLDRYEPEPRRLLAAGLLWGGFVATVGAVLIGGIGGLVVGVTEEAALAVVAPITEEATKGAFLLLLLWWRRHELDGILDGIVYAGMVGIGFAFVENILYLAAAYDGTDGLGPGGTEAITTTFVIRCLFSPFAHPLFTAFIGIGVGIAVTTRSPATRVMAPVTGYFLAVAAHGLWNGSTLVADGAGFIGVYVFLMVPAFALMIVFAVWQRRSERRMLLAALADAASRGLIPATDIPFLVDLKARRSSRAWARQQGGDEAESTMRDYQQAAIELGFLHHRYLRGTAPHDFASRGQEHLAQLQALRPHISFPGQVVPTR
ncbi:PrsW family intramembrane metalloprotease [Nocardioides sp.]|uniref:PrsW family intramembrane metalloprotease n=1 Tax=Nocardioides sp. TaxID=35761 RepID=UPI00273510BB|nr:PrsW family intramembrane metalloprotease [Nocardioides sp.]MDP3893136.1 PrsW family intramembrane metalloprotease [Nocardioides sp.]